MDPVVGPGGQVLRILRFLEKSDPIGNIALLSPQEAPFGEVLGLILPLFQDPVHPGLRKWNHPAPGTVHSVLPSCLFLVFEQIAA